MTFRPLKGHLPAVVEVVEEAVEALWVLVHPVHLKIVLHLLQKRLMTMGNQHPLPPVMAEVVAMVKVVAAPVLMIPDTIKVQQQVVRPIKKRS